MFHITGVFLSAPHWTNLGWNVHVCRLYYKTDVHKLKIIHSTATAMLKDFTIQHMGEVEGSGLCNPEKKKLIWARNASVFAVALFQLLKG